MPTIDEALDHDEALRLATLASNKKAFYASFNQSDIFHDCPMMNGEPLRKAACIKRQELANRRYGTKFNYPGDHNAFSMDMCKNCPVGKKLKEEQP